MKAAQNDSMADECADVTLSNAPDPLKAKDLPDILERSPPFLLVDDVESR
jgi:hypothetical protein